MASNIRLIRAIFHSYKGLRAAISSEAAFQQEALVLAIAIPLSFFITTSPWKQCALIAVILLIMIVELLNTAVEKLADLVNPDFHPEIGRIKDMGSAAVSLAIIIAIVIWCVALIERFV